MKKKILSVLFVCLIIAGITSCGSQKNNDAKVNDKNNKNSNEVITAKLHRVGKFIDGYWEIGVDGSNLSSTSYLVNENMEAGVTWTGGATSVGAYVQDITADENDEFHVYDALGNKVFTYKEKDYEQVKLASHGYLFIKKKNDTYNSTETTIGVYDLATKKYVVEPSAKYTQMVESGEYMYYLTNDEKTFFNTKSGKIVEFDKAPTGGFYDGYCLDVNNEVIVVYKDDGTIKKIPYKVNSTSYMDKDAVANGYYSDIVSRESGSIFRVVDLENGKIKDFSNMFYHITNKPKFNKDGYALVVFSNQGYVPYYTVIDLEGKMKFEPAKLSSDNNYTSTYDKELNYIKIDEIVDDKYILLAKNGNAKTEIRDLNNKLIYQGKDDENYISVVNDTVVVNYSYHGLSKFYFMGIDGKEKQIKIVTKQ